MLEPVLFYDAEPVGLHFSMQWHHRLLLACNRLLSYQCVRVPLQETPCSLRKWLVSIAGNTRLAADTWATLFVSSLLWIGCAHERFSTLDRSMLVEKQMEQFYGTVLVALTTDQLQDDSVQAWLGGWKTAAFYDQLQVARGSRVTLATLARTMLFYVLD